GDRGQRPGKHPGIGPVGECRPAALPVAGVRVGRGQRLQVDHVVWDADAVVAEFIGGPGDVDDLTGVEERGADVVLHGCPRAHAGMMNTPSAWTVTPSASLM